MEKKRLDFFDRFSLALPKIIIFLFVYSLLPFISPVAFKLNLNGLGQGIQYVYQIFCHQRVERSMFLFADDGLVKFYTIEQLEEIGYIKATDKPGIYGDGWELYQYPYWGNEQIGYKVAYCIRDIGLYLGLSFASLFLYIYILKKKKIVWLKWYWVLLLCLPMMIDGVFQTFLEILGPYILGSYYDLKWVAPYVSNIDKRWISGLLFGIGFAFIVIPNLVDSSNYIETEKDD
jgi:uncharacterized membrane protein